MPSKPKILAFAGSARKDSFNKKLIRIASAHAQTAGAEVTLIDLRDLPMPLFDQDMEASEGAPANVRKFKELLIAHSGLLISCPEYNSSITPLLKNAIDWASRPAEGEASLACFTGKTAALMSASPGALGGLRGLVTVRSLLGNIGVLVLPSQVAVPKAHEAFDEKGGLKDARVNESLQKLASGLVEILTKLRN